MALANHLPSWAVAQRDRGPVAATTELRNLRLRIARSPAKEAAFQQLLLNQQDPASPRYHRWLSPQQIGEQFGPDSAMLAHVQQWLASQGLTLDSIANSRAFLVFHGTAAQVEQAFHAQLHRYATPDGPMLSLASPPQIPQSLAGIVVSVEGLSQHRLRPAVHVKAVATQNADPLYTACYSTTCYHYVTPADFATIYSVPTTYTGAGQTIAIVGRAQVYSYDVTEYESQTGLPSQLETLIVPPAGVEPPAPNNSTTQAVNADQTEATLDVERVFGIAPGAAVDLVASLSTQTEDGIDIAKDYVIDNQATLHASVLNISFGACESAVAASTVQADDALFQQAAAEGISVVVAAGDAGAAGCDAYLAEPPPAPAAISPNYLCSSSYVTCMGGTEFADTDSTTYWSTTNAAHLASAKGYIPEGAWNEPQSGTSYYAAATGGGISSVIAIPYWQQGTGVPGTAGRYTPDLAFTASEHDAYYGCYAAVGGNCAASEFAYFYGTSAAAPSMAGIAVMLNQKLGTAQGNLNPVLYALAQAPANNVFHDVTIATSGVANCTAGTPSMCNNSVPGEASLGGGEAGYLLNTGFDLATGWGSLNVANLLASWATGGPAATTTAFTVLPSASIPLGTPVTLQANVTSNGAAVSGVAGLYLGSSLVLNMALSAGVGSVVVNTAGLPAGSYPLSANFPGSATDAPSTSAATMVTLVNATSTTAIAASPTTVTEPGEIEFGAQVTSPAGTPTGTVTFYFYSDALITVPLSNGIALFTTSTSGLPTASYPIYAVYNGGGGIASSTSGAVTVTVN